MAVPTAAKGSESQFWAEQFIATARMAMVDRVVVLAVIARQEPPMRIRANDPRIKVRSEGVMELVVFIGHRT